MNSYDLSAYDFELPEELIAQYPVEPRDTSRLMVVDRRSGRIEHRNFQDFPEFFNSGDLIIANNSKVIRARLLGKRKTPHSGKVEFFALKKTEDRIYEGLIRSSARVSEGFEFQVEDPSGVPLEVVVLRAPDRELGGVCLARFGRDPIESGLGEIPLPPYIHRDSERKFNDEESYQTVYADRLGSVAAPTAGLHFSPAIKESLNKRGVTWSELTLHVGLGTFQPVKSDDLRDHQMHRESYEISEATTSLLTEAKREGRSITAVGTTSLRSLESASIEGGVEAGIRDTDIFFYPGSERKIRMVDRLLTNFHLPKSTLFMLVSAYAGSELMREAYLEAVRREYRFFSYGDGMLIL